MHKKVLQIHFKRLGTVVANLSYAVDLKNLKRLRMFKYYLPQSTSKYSIYKFYISTIFEILEN